jgi:hypothetical protein
MTTDKLVPALQITDEKILLDAMDALEGAGFICGSEDVCAFGPDYMPEWAQPAHGGWLLLVEADRFDEAMEFLGDLMGYEAD